MFLVPFAANFSPRKVICSQAETNISRLFDNSDLCQDLATVDSILLRELPPVEDIDAVSTSS